METVTNVEWNGLLGMVSEVFALFCESHEDLLFFGPATVYMGLPWWLSGRESACQCRRLKFNPWVGKDPLEKEMATHSSILAWEIPWTEEPGGLQSMASQRIRHD